MKKFFEEYGAAAIIVIVIAVLLLIVGSVKGLDETTGKVNGSGVASIVGNAYSSAIGKFDESFNGTLSNNSNDLPSKYASLKDYLAGKSFQYYTIIHTSDGSSHIFLFNNDSFLTKNEYENKNLSKDNNYQGGFYEYGNDFSLAFRNCSYVTFTSNEFNYETLSFENLQYKYWLQNYTCMYGFSNFSLTTNSKSVLDVMQKLKDSNKLPKECSIKFIKL